jgi:hypothetical protein
MDPFILKLFTQVSITILGFSGVTTALGHLSSNTRYISIRTKGLLFAASIAFIASIGPLAGFPEFFAAIFLAIAALSTSCICLYAFTKSGANSSLVWPVHIALITSSLWLVYNLITNTQQIGQPYIATTALLIISSVILFIRLVISIDLGGLVK